jgi:hydroxyacylglutathione hydrolase
VASATPAALAVNPPTSGEIARAGATVARVIFTQFVDDDLGCASYLVGDEQAGEAFVVDPAYAIEQYLEEAERRGVRVVRVLETHTHADHVSGHGRLALEQGIPISIHAAAEAKYPHDALADGDELAAGDVVLRCLHTPGHRPEHSCFAVIDRSRADEPWLLLTGDSLFVGDAARPDLAVEARKGAEGMFHSLRRLLELPDGVEVYPGHVAGSLCGRAMSSKASTTIGFERRFNALLAISDLEAFVAESTANGAPKPPNVARIVELNRGPLLGRSPDISELPAPPEGAQLLDVRPAEDFLAGHRHGAVSVPVSGSSFATKAGYVLDPEQQVCVLAGDALEAEHALRGLRSVGFLDVPGYVLGGGPERMSPVSVDELEQLLDDGAQVIDVREKDERDDGYIPGTRNIPYRLLGDLADDMPSDRPVVTVCESGARATVAASVLAAHGIDARPVVDGGIGSWLASGRQLTHFRRCG